MTRDLIQREGTTASWLERFRTSVRVEVEPASWMILRDRA
jgi:hypothetical protein